MENIDFAALIPFVFLTVYTPGPANITCASLGIKHGLKESINFVYGSALGFTVMSLLAGLFSNLLLSIVPSLASIMRWVGAAYILYLAYHMLKTDYSFAQNNNQTEIKPLGFKYGFLIQLVNPKSIIFLLTLYTTFLYSAVEQTSFIFIFALILGLIGFGSNLLWTFLGAGISQLLNQERIKKIVNLVLALILVYLAVRLTGILH
ncbi:MAG TPA: LysE family translocator [Atribacterota bacterium]|nr:LysE family translocator [Atribacterota bacterium]